MADFEQERLALWKDINQVKGKVDIILEALKALQKEVEAPTITHEEPDTITQPFVT